MHIEGMPVLSENEALRKLLHRRLYASNFAGGGALAAGGLRARFLRSVTGAEQFPSVRPLLAAHGARNFAFFGRSNVGKSSLINALLSEPLARTSKTPGRTQAINLFGADRAMLADLPGYGYARAPVRAVEAWRKLSLGFLGERGMVDACFVLLDARRGAAAADREVLRALRRLHVPRHVVFTKADAVGVGRWLELVQQGAGEGCGDGDGGDDAKVILASSKMRCGIQTIKDIILNN